VSRAVAQPQTIYHDHMNQLTAVDLFAGAGGATTGLVQAGFRVVAAVENDISAAQSYRANHPEVVLVEDDIRNVDPARLLRGLRLRPGRLDLLKACPPCQGFSSLAKGNVDEDRNDLVLDVSRFVEAFRPKAILLENVPGLSRDIRLDRLLKRLTKFGYRFQQYFVDAFDLGVPQRRKRLIVVGLHDLRKKNIPAHVSDLVPGFSNIRRMTVRDALAGRPNMRLEDDPLAKHRTSSPVVLARIMAVPQNGSRFDLPPEHRLDCHNRLRGRRATASYGRVKWDEPSPTMTTRCTTPSCGTFIHPDEHRGLTLREAALLQTFPMDYVLLGGYDSVERQIGNAVPVQMARALGISVRNLLVGKASQVSSVEA
jgi:DNA (cytosine-5)-methyltransferase 1